MQLADHVYNYRGSLLNSITKVMLPPDSDRADLEDGFFLEGQREQALQSLLGAAPRAVHFDVIPTMACNLRCRHCCVLHKLDNDGQTRIDIDRFIIFVRRYLDHYPTVERATFHLVGGEPLLEPMICARTIELAADLPIPCTTSCVTNLAVELTPERKAAALGVDRLIVSVDGNEPEHNRQRHAYRARFDPYARTMENLRALLADGLDPSRAEIQAAVQQEDLTAENKRSFYTTFLKLGFPVGQIRYGMVYPTVRSPSPSPNYLAVLKRPDLHPRPCCKFRLMGNFAISGDNISTGYNDAETCVIGKLDDPITLIAANFANLITRMPALSDPTCRACPALGFCWGGCDLTGEALVKGHPSRFCDQAAMVAEVRHRADEGSLPGVL
jgi:radical SAM protein with 4Fe4S-binding SPASM domain